jgi:heme/copper-type cytochrome/quinol oxidase subunit 1
MMRSQQALAFHAAGYLPPDHYNQVFSAHGTIMIFFGAMPFVIGLMNFVVPLQLGVREPRQSLGFPSSLIAFTSRRRAGLNQLAASPPPRSSTAAPKSP